LQNPKKSIDISQFPDGVYFAEVKNTNDETILKKIIKSNTTTTSPQP
jgi:hypothetical protein